MIKAIEKDQIMRFEYFRDSFHIYILIRELRALHSIY